MPHPAFSIIWLVTVGLVLIRTVVWRYRPFVSCETCAHSGKAKRIIRGNGWVELIVLSIGLTVGLIIMEILWVTIVYFLWRSLGSYLTCDNCGSERIARVKRVG